MDTIKVSIDVNIDFSENVKAFLSGLFGTTKPTATPEIIKPAATATIAQTEKKETTTKSQAAPAPKVPAAPASNIKIDQVRKALAEKVVDHRATIKAKLEELGAPSVTKLDPAKYEEMYNFLIAL